MRLTALWTTFLVCVLFWKIPECLGSGVFELRLKSFTNDYGKDNIGRCCSGESPSLTGECSGPCQTRFRVCLKHYQALIDTTSPCTFGDVVTPVLGQNSLYFSKLNREGFVNPITFKFDFTWPGTFSLILEALHDNNGTTRGSGPGWTLISRLTTQRWLDPGKNWTQDEHISTHSSMEYEYRVTCDTNYYGSGCANYCRPRDDTFGHFSCQPGTGLRICDTGWTGEYCEKPKCLPGCSEEHGHCDKPNQCLCKHGWQGRLCDECERHPGCLHGTCKKQWECNCTEGWGGLFCNQDLNFCTNHKPCQNDGVCFNTGQGSYTCQCKPGYTGTDCEKKLDGCSSHNPCQNGGTCRDRGQKYFCECQRGFHGEHCEVSTLTCRDTVCDNGGTCDDSPQGYKCRCIPGYGGTNCEKDIDECASSPCANNGTCLDHLNRFSCKCPEGFSGSRCEINIDDCAGKTCLNGGTCVDLVAGHRCQCIPGYVGAQCESVVDYCITKPCANGATCTNLVNDYRCMCRAGFRGKDCSVDIDECLSSPCRNGATCLNRVNNFECKCVGGYTGRTCNEVAWRTGNMSKHVAPPVESVEETSLTTEHVVVIATLSTAVPFLVLVSAVVVICLKQRRKREAAKADEEARLQNEQNSVHSSMIKNTWGKSVNTDVRENAANSDTCCGGGGGGGVISGGGSGGKSTIPDPGPLYALMRTRSQKQLNTDSAAHRASMRTSALLPAVKLDKERPDPRISVLSVDFSLCNSGENQLVKRPYEKGSLSGLSTSTTAGTPSSVYVIDEHFLHSNTLATEV